MTMPEKIQLYSNMGVPLPASDIGEYVLASDHARVVAWLTSELDMVQKSFHNKRNNYVRLVEAIRQEVTPASDFRDPVDEVRALHAERDQLKAELATAREQFHTVAGIHPDTSRD